MSDIETLRKALELVWAFATHMVDKHGMNGNDSMTDEEHQQWQDAAASANHALRDEATE